MEYEEWEAQVLRKSDGIRYGRWKPIGWLSISMTWPGRTANGFSPILGVLWPSN